MQLSIPLHPGEEPQHQRLGKRPGLAVIILHIGDFQPHFFPHFPADGVLQRLAEFHESGNQAIAARRAAGIAGQQQFPLVFHCHNNSGIDPGIDHIAAFGADHRPLIPFQLHGLSAVAAETVDPEPPIQMPTFHTGKQSHRIFHRAQHLGTLPEKARHILHRMRMPETKIPGLIHRKQINGLHGRLLGQLAGPGQSVIPLAHRLQ